MGYSIAYNSGSTTPFGTYKQGTITMGLKPDEYTVSSGFTWYANAETPNDNYLIISDTYSQGWSTQAESKPTIWRSETGTTESFVSLVNQLPDVNGVTGFTNSVDAMNYLLNSEKYFVLKNNYLGIVDEDLVFNLDAGWNSSYSGGTTWYDLSGNGNHGTLVNGSGFNSGNLGSITFDGTNDSVELYKNASELGFANNSFSVTIWYNANVTTNDAPLFSTWGGGVNTYLHYNLRGHLHMGFYTNDTKDGSPSINTTYCAVFVYDVTAQTQKIYVDGVLRATGSNKPALQSNADFKIGGRYSGWYNGKIFQIMAHTKALSADEVQQNYNVQKGRFGL